MLKSLLKGVVEGLMESTLLPALKREIVKIFDLNGDQKISYDDFSIQEIRNLAWLRIGKMLAVIVILVLLVYYGVISLGDLEEFLQASMSLPGVEYFAGSTDPGEASLAWSPPLLK